MTDSPADWIDRLQFLISPGAMLGAVGVGLTGLKVGPVIMDFITGQERKRDRREEQEDEDRRRERDAIERDRTLQVDRLQKMLDEAQKEILGLKHEIHEWRNECGRERELRRMADDRTDFQRRSGQRYYEIGARAYALLLQARHDWLMQLAPPKDNLVAFEDLTGTKPPANPDERTPQRRSTD